MPLLWLPIAAAFMWRGVLAGLPPLLLPLTLAIGVLVWQLLEYSIHRWVVQIRRPNSAVPPVKPCCLRLSMLVVSGHVRARLAARQLLGVRSVFPRASVVGLCTHGAAWAIAAQVVSPAGRSCQLPPHTPSPTRPSRWLFHFEPKSPKGIEWHFMLHG